MESIQNIEIESCRSIYMEHLPPSRVIDTENILERIGEEWKNPGPSQHQTSSEIDQILGDWVRFFNKAQREYDIEQSFKGNGGSLINLNSLAVFKQAAEKDEQYPEIITSMRDAFLALCSNKKREQMGKNKPKVIVDNELKSKIITFVRKMEALTLNYWSEETDRLSDIDDVND
jgi:hypothetical protein